MDTDPNTNRGHTDTHIQESWTHRHATHKNHGITDTKNTQNHGITDTHKTMETHETPTKNTNHKLQITNHGHTHPQDKIKRCFAENFGWVRLLVVCFLNKTNPNPRNNICCGKKSGPIATFNLIFLGFGLA